MSKGSFEISNEQSPDGEKEAGYSKCQVTANKNEFGVFENEQGAGSQA